MNIPALRPLAPIVDDTAILAVLTLSTPSGTVAECLSVPAHRTTIAGAVIRCANAHGIAASMVVVSVLYPESAGVSADAA